MATSNEVNVWLSIEDLIMASEKTKHLAKTGELQIPRPFTTRKPEK